MDGRRKDELLEMTTVEIEAESVEEAREKLHSQIPEGMEVLSEVIIHDGKPAKLFAEGWSCEKAFMEAQKKMPENAEILERKVNLQAKEIELIIKAYDEQSAKIKAKEEGETQLGKTAFVSSIELITLGKVGFLGIGNKPNDYKVIVTVWAEVEIAYRTKAKLRAEIAKPLKILTGEAWFLELVEELASIYHKNPEGFSNPFLPAKSIYSRPGIGDPNDRKRLKEIGKLLDSQGGFPLMKETHRLFAQNCTVPGAPRNLECMWDGIGKWRG